MKATKTFQTLNRIDIDRMINATPIEITARPVTGPAASPEAAAVIVANIPNDRNGRGSNWDAITHTTALGEST